MASSYLQIEALTKSYGDRMLFADITFGIDEGDKIGLIAKNGSGKSTLLKIIAAQEDADSGKITFRNDLRVAYLPQIPDFGTSVTIRDVMSQHAPTDLVDHDDYVARLERTLQQLGISNLDATVDKLSGGEKKRIAIAQAVVDSPELLILDEPTNHLDIDAIEWLESYLSRSRVALLMVTHDRYFLDRVCNKIIEIDNCTTYTYQGNYDYYLRRRQERIEAMTAEQAKLKNTLRREQEWMRRQPQARAGKAKFRIDAFYDLKDRTNVNLTQRDVNLDVKSSYIGSKIFEAHNLSKRYGDKVVLDDFTYTFARYEKVGIIGANGVGKSTFIKMLQGLEQPDSGTIDVGETVRFGYYSQSGISFDENKKVIDAITEIAEDVVVNDTVHYSPMQFLQRFLFSPADQQKYIHTLSGGERCRLHLASVLMRSPNFLILDEPTNDLDIITLGILENYLSEYKGCVIVISHDRFFLDNIADHLFVFTGDGQVKDFPGTYSEYRQWSDEQKRLAAKPETSDPATTRQTRRQTERKRKLSYKEQREMESLEIEIEQLTAEKEALTSAFSDATATDDIAAKAARYAEVNALLDEKEMRWLELSEIES